MKITVIGCGRWGSLITWCLAEGYYTVKVMLKLGEEQQVDLPICQSVSDILYKKADAKTVLNQLFTRSLKNEF